MTDKDSIYRCRFYSQPGRPDAKDKCVDQIIDDILDCTSCPLHNLGRTNPVPGSGDMGTRLMFVGEGPGEQEDLQGMPFVGRSGDLLIEAFRRPPSFERGTFFITNVVKCRPPGNRNPTPAEMEVCGQKFLYKQIEIINPCVIVALGKIASEYLLGHPVKITKENGLLHFLDQPLCENDPPVMTVFHPAYVLRNRKPETLEVFFQAITFAKEVAYGTFRNSNGGLCT